MRETIPSKQYIALLDIKDVLRSWQDLDIPDTIALFRIDRVLTELVNATKLPLSN